MSTDRSHHGGIKFVAWGLLLLLVMLLYARESVFRFLDDFFPKPVSPHLAAVEPPRLAPFELHEENRPRDENLIRPPSGDERASLLRERTADPIPMAPRLPSESEADSETTYATRYGSKPSPSPPPPRKFFSPLDRDPLDRPGAALSPNEIPSLVFPEAAPAPAKPPAALPEIEPASELASIPKIRDRDRLNAYAPMVELPGGVFTMGSDHAGEADQRPRHRVRLSPFKLDCYPVTNRQFQLFVRETGYRTSAERLGWSFVFDLDRKAWVRMAGACWWNPAGKHPGAGPESGAVAAMLDLPVVHVSWDDAQSFCAWSGKRLPSEAEWEYAAKGGRLDALYPWGDLRRPEGVEQANYWQGWFPEENTLLDGYPLLSPVGAFAANPYGLFDLGGNAWEWCADRYRSDYYRLGRLDNPLGPLPEEGETTLISTLRLRREGGHYVETEPDGVREVPLRVIRGGSFLSSENSDAGYRVTARGNQPQPLSFQDVGFRCAENWNEP